MLLLKNLTLKNFLSHADTEIDFRKNQKVLIDGASGAGKSAIVESILWALYGQGRVHGRSLIHLGAKETVVSVDIQDDDITYKIERNVNTKGKHSLNIYQLRDYENNNYLRIKKYQLIPTRSLKETQEMIEKTILRASYSLFVNSIAYPQDNIDSFVKQTAIKRKDLMLEIIKAADYDEYYTKTKEALTKIKQIEETNKVIITNNQQMIKIEEETVRLLPSYRERDTALKNKIEEIKKQIQECDILYSQYQITRVKVEEKYKNIQEMNAQLGFITEKIKSLLDKKDELTAIDKNEIALGMKKLEQKRIELKQLREKQNIWNQWNEKRINIERAKPLIQDYDGIIKQLNDQIMEVMRSTDTYCPEIGKVCPRLEQQVKDKNQFFVERLKEQYKNKQKCEDALALYEQKLEALGQSPETVNNEILETEEKKMLKLQNYEKQYYILENLDNRKIEIEKEINDLRIESNNRQTKIKETEVEILLLQANITKRNIDKERIEFNNTYRITNMEYAANLQLLAVAEQKKEMVKKMREETETLQDQLKLKEEEKDSLKLLAEAFGPNGIKAVLIDYIIPRLEDKINDILSKTSNFCIKLETQKSGLGKDTTLEGLFITIINDAGEELDFMSYSGGERMRIIIAISEGLADLSKQIGFRILDEAIVGLDQDTAEGFSKVILDVQDRFNQLICISHLQNIKDMFNEKIEIVKINGVSRII